MDLRTYLIQLGRPGADEFAARCNSNLGHLRNIGYGLRRANALLASAIERESGGAVTRRELRSDWREIWPELASVPRMRANRKSQGDKA